MLHDPRPRRRGQNLLLSVTADTLPPTVDFIRRRVRHSTHPAHWLVVIRDGIAYDELAYAYTRRLPGWARARVYTPLGVADPAEDLEAHRRDRWWDPTQPVTPEMLSAMEEAAAAGGYVIPWRHPWLLDPPA